jgi:hypothetical protein
MVLGIWSSDHSRPIEGVEYGSLTRYHKLST